MTEISASPSAGTAVAGDEIPLVRIITPHDADAAKKGLTPI
ncbi:hypothetical protein [Lichenicola cladoniae]|nr:hypothetical protein [Lichenicola cladoniae]